jgi:ATP-dependent RNA helicase SUPV3L1/SUV3
MYLETVYRRVKYLLSSNSIRASGSANKLTETELKNVVLGYRDVLMTNLKKRMDDGNYGGAPAKIPSPKELYNAYVSQDTVGLDQVILKYFQNYLVEYGHSWPSNVNMKRLLAATDMRNPGEWWAGARGMRRKIIMHVGPTNSGKTYRALKRLEKAERGWFGGPLRLLAREVFNRMNSKGIPCNLQTGEEIHVVDINARLTSSTIEMFSTARTYDIAVIDEIQMIANPERGFAWTAALLGLEANEIHLCGEESAVPLVTKIVEELGDEIEVHKYERLSPLRVEHEAISMCEYVKPGDCVVAFSRQDIFRIKNRIELWTGLRCAVVYGALPPEARNQQANLFNNPDSGYDVIVASDAIGMGLNLYPHSIPSH